MLCHKLMDGLKNLNSDQLETQEVTPGWDPVSPSITGQVCKRIDAPRTRAVANCYGSFTGGHTLRRPVNKKTWSQWESGRFFFLFSL